MKIEGTGIFGVLLITPDVHEDWRGIFFEMYRANLFPKFVQDNLVYSNCGVLRGIHYQSAHPQGKLFAAITGAVYEVAVDVRRDSPTFGQWVAVTLSEINHQMLYVPAGFACGTYAIDDAHLFYKVTDYYDPGSVVHIAWDDPDLAIPWPLDGSPTHPMLSDADEHAQSFRELFG
jgi:dTDP-4-dehydrorhamnose 3,5-epimerase